MDMAISVGNLLTIATVIVTVAVAWGVIRTQVATHDRKIETLEKLQEDSQKCQAALDVKLARIETDLQWIRHALAGEKKAGE